jgi:two-component system nitrogen regulation sensor histidine kinase GlnL
MPAPLETRAPVAPDTAAVLSALPIAVLVVDAEQRIVSVNPAAEQLLGASDGYLTRHRLTDLLPEGNQLVSLIEQVSRRGHSVSEYGVLLSSPRIGECLVDLQVAPIAETPGRIVVCLEERTMARKLDRQLTHRGAVRSVAGMSAVLAHEVKNPLSGIRGAAQLLEQSLGDSERELTQLICSEADRIRDLVERMDVFADDRPLVRDRVNIHTVLEHVRRLMASAAGPGVRFVEQYDPSLPPVRGNRDQLIQVFLNLVKNAVEAVPENGGEIVLSTSFRHGLRLASFGSDQRHLLPIVASIQDNGPGIPEDLRNHLFDPFVTTKRSGTGLGLSLVAKIIEDHGGLIECESARRRTVFSVRLPATDEEADEQQPGGGAHG